MKKNFLRAALICCITGIFCTACKPKTNEISNRKKIICSIFPEYDWTYQLIGSQSQTTTLTLLVKNGVDLHSYQPSAKDIVQIGACDLFIYVGGESDIWIEEALRSAENNNMVVIKLMDVLKDTLKEEYEGIDDFFDEIFHESNENSETETEEEIEYDEHVWLSLKNAKVCCKAIADALCNLDPQNSGLYKTNLDSYIKQLDILDSRFELAVEGAKNTTLIVCDRFPFKYLFDDYYLNYYAAFSGCSAESEASFETISFLSNKIDELKLNSVFVIETSNKKLAKSVIYNSKNPLCDILTLDSMQNTTLSNAMQGKTYIYAMTQNLDNIKKALY